MGADLGRDRNRHPRSGQSLAPPKVQHDRWHDHADLWPWIVVLLCFFLLVQLAGVPKTKLQSRVAVQQEEDRCMPGP